MKQMPNNIDRHDWDARASEALANAKKLPPGSERNDAIKTAGRLRVAADMKKFAGESAREDQYRVPSVGPAIEVDLKGS